MPTQEEFSGDSVLCAAIEDSSCVGMTKSHQKKNPKQVPKVFNAE
jgi:hypothetical protein